MLNHPLVVGVRQYDTSCLGGPLKGPLEGLGRNTGNMMFTEALFQVLADAKWGAFNFTQQDLVDRDCIVLASANWINGFEDFGWLADRLEKTSLPVFLIGVGAQASLGMEMPQVRAGTRRLLELVRDRSTSIAARGIFTCEVLEQLGIKTAVETGCPSLLLAGANGPTIARGSFSLQTCVLHSTRHGFQRADAFQRWLYNQAFKNQYDIVLQSEVSDIYLALDSIEQNEITEAGLKAVLESYGTDDMNAIRLYLQERGHVFLNYTDWVAFMKTRSLCLGTRIHGTVASLLAGTPATLICHDSRTLEMANSMSLPMVLSTSLNVDKDLSVESLSLPDANARFVRSYKSYYERFQRYFAQNQISVSD